MSDNVIQPPSTVASGPHPLRPITEAIPSGAALLRNVFVDTRGGATTRPAPATSPLPTPTVLFA